MVRTSIVLDILMNCSKSEVAALGGILLGVIEIFARAYISTQIADAVVFAVLIVILLIRPAGLLGKPVNEKV